MAAGLVSRHVSADGTLVRANASYKSFVPIEVALDPEEYKRRLRAQDAEPGEAGPPDPGNRAVDFRGEKRSNATHRSVTDPDCRFVSKGSFGDRRLSRLHRQCADGEPPSLPAGARAWRSSRAPRRRRWAVWRCWTARSGGCGFTPITLGRRQGLLPRGLHRGAARAATSSRTSRPRPAGRSAAHARVRMRNAGLGVSPVATVSEDDRGALRRGQGLAWAAALPRAGWCGCGRRRYLIGWVLNLKRLAKHLGPAVNHGCPSGRHLGAHRSDGDSALPFGSVTAFMLTKTTPAMSLSAAG